MNEQTQKALSYYWSFCIYQRLRDMGLITAAEFEKACAVSQKRYGVAVFVS
jgi:hypothetical protein